MPISYPLTLPSTPGPRHVEWLSDSSVASSVAPATFQFSRYDYAGKMRSIRIEYPPMTLANGKIWTAAIYKLNGAAGTFYFGDTVGKVGQGTLAGAAAVNGAGQTGGILVMDGLDGGDSVVAGDWLSVGDRLYTVLTDASESGGSMSVAVWPDVDDLADDAAISYGASARGVFRLDEFPSLRWDVTRLLASVTLEATEEFV